MFIYPPDALSILEFNKIIELIKENCAGTYAKQKAANLKPTNNFNKITTELNRVNELKQIFDKGGYFPEINAVEAISEIRLLKIDGSVLTSSQIILLKRLVESANTLVSFLKRNQNSFPYLSPLVNNLEPRAEVITAIEKIIDNQGYVLDSASSKLKEIRQLLSAKRNENYKRFNQLIQQYNKLGYLRDIQESYINERRVLAVLSEFKREISGVIHSVSDSGKTTFIEPLETLEINNKIAELLEEEQREINKLLRNLCNFLRPYADDFFRYYILLGTLDFIRAKVYVAKQLNAVLPVVEFKPVIKYIGAVHPILYLQNKLNQKKTVPFLLSLSNTHRILIISGPNAGGKSITLKAVGLLQVMIQSGLLIPCNPDSVVGVFNRLMLDIGDQQSIENELSTYSARLQRMNIFIKTLTAKSLFLIDEMGSGTDPELGGALAEALLENFASYKSFGIVTTHYPNIKLLAQKNRVFINGCMLFNQANLQPTYVLSIGQPGSSFTFEVAKQIGLPEIILKQAKQKLENNQIKLNQLLIDLQNEKNKAIRKNAELDRAIQQQKQAEQRYNELIQLTQQKSESTREKLMELNAMAILGKKFYRLIEGFENTKEKKTETYKKVIGLIKAESERKRLEQVSAKKIVNKQKQIEEVLKWISPGMEVKLAQSLQTGVVEKVGKTHAFVLFGDKKSKVSLELLKKV
jgi:DNA mismatch repair protein MutS2